MRFMRSHNLAYFRWFRSIKNPACTSLYKRDFMLFRQYKMRVMRPHELPVVVRFVGTIYS